MLEANGLEKSLHEAKLAFDYVFRGFLPQLAWLRRPFLFESAEVVAEFSTK
jgi:hypothetical protein